MTSETLTMVRGVPHGKGWMAWSKLFDRCVIQNAVMMARES